MPIIAVSPGHHQTHHQRRSRLRRSRCLAIPWRWDIPRPATNFLDFLAHFVAGHRTVLRGRSNQRSVAVTDNKCRPVSLTRQPHVTSRGLKVRDTQSARRGQAASRTADRLLKKGESRHVQLMFPRWSNCDVGTGLWHARVCRQVRWGWWRFYCAGRASVLELPLRGSAYAMSDPDASAVVTVAIESSDEMGFVSATFAGPHRARPHVLSLRTGFSRSLRFATRTPVNRRAAPANPMT